MKPVARWHKADGDVYIIYVSTYRSMLILGWLAGVMVGFAIGVLLLAGACS